MAIVTRSTKGDFEKTPWPSWLVVRLVATRPRWPRRFPNTLQRKNRLISSGHDGHEKCDMNI